MPRRIPVALEWLAIASEGPRRLQERGREQSRGPGVPVSESVRDMGDLVGGKCVPDARKGASEGGGRWCVGSGGSRAGRACQACNGELCAYGALLLKDWLLLANCSRRNAMAEAPIAN